MDKLCKLSHTESQHLSYPARPGFQLDCMPYPALDWGFSTVAGSIFPTLLLWGTCASSEIQTHMPRRDDVRSFWDQRWCEWMPERQKTDSFSLNFHCTALVLHHIHITDPLNTEKNLVSQSQVSGNVAAQSSSIMDGKFCWQMFHSLSHFQIISAAAWPDLILLNQPKMVPKKRRYMWRRDDR